MTGQSERGDLAKVVALIEEIRIALVTTVDHQGQLHTRPLQTLQVESGPTVWFFTDWNSPKVQELQRDDRVSLGYASLENKVFVAASGTGQLLRNPAKAQQLWSTEQRAFYPEGPTDERLALLKVRLERAEYWLAPGPLSYLVAAAQAVATGTPAEIIGENRKIR